MSIKIEPFKNNIGASIACDLKSIKADEVVKTKEALNNYGFVCFRNQNLRQEFNNSKVPNIFVSIKNLGVSIERSTCDSAAKFIIASG